MLESRLESELSLLRSSYGEVHYEPNGHWIQILSYKVPEPWQPADIPVVFNVTVGYPGAPPYGFFVPRDLQCAGRAPSAATAKLAPPFVGSWLFLSWQATNWMPTADVQSGSNLWGWSRGFGARFAEGP